MMLKLAFIAKETGAGNIIGSLKKEMNGKVSVKLAESLHCSHI